MIKKENLTLLSLVITFVAAYVETDVYVPSFPEMLHFFKTNEKTLQLVVSMNFAGIFIGSLISGPISDRFGRKTPLLLALFGFTLTSLACALSNQISHLIFWRFLQGICVSMPMAIPCAILMDKYSAKRAAILISFLGGIITATLAFAPAMGGWLQITFGWKGSFIFITISSTIAFIANFFFLEETLQLSKRIPINIKSIFNDYITILHNRKFMFNTSIMSFMYAAFIIYISNLSLLFVTHLHMDETIFIFYQSTTAVAYVIGCLSATKVINWLGLEKTRNIGSILAIVGALLFFGVALFVSTEPTFITGSFTLISLGSALSSGVYFVDSVEPFPTMNGKAMAMSVSLRQIITSAIILMSSAFFNGSVMPISISLLIITILCYLCFIGIRKL